MRTRLLLLPLLAALALSTLAGCSKDDPPEPVRGSTTVTVDGQDVAAIVRSPQSAAAVNGKPVTILFLHGQSYTSRIWFDQGILEKVADESGFRAVAIDLPGYGETPERDDQDTSDAAWLGDLIDELGGPEQVVVVSPSMSGDYSLSYLMVHPDAKLLGFVPVAPVGIDDFLRPEDAAPIPAVSIWGSEDPSYTAARAKHLLTQLRGGDEDSTEIMEGASHACYEDQPVEFTELVVAFLATLTR